MNILVPYLTGCVTFSYALLTNVQSISKHTIVIQGERLIRRLYFLVTSWMVLQLHPPMILSEVVLNLYSLTSLIFLVCFWNQSVCFSLTLDITSYLRRL